MILARIRPIVPRMDLTTVDHLLSTTRAVRKRLDLTRPVPRDVVVECLRLAIQAPTGSNAQRWRWIVVTDPDTRSAIADLYRNPPLADAGGSWPEGEVTPQQRRVMDSSKYLTEHLQEVPVLVVPCTEDAGGAAGWAPSMYPAVWNLMLALRSRGLGSCMTTAHLFRRGEAAALLGIPNGFVQSCLVPVAYYKGDDFQPAVRRPVEEITYWNRWGNTEP
jgi:nitroreductase